MRHAHPSPSRRDDRSRQQYYEDEMRQEYYDSGGFPDERLPYPDAAVAQLHHQQRAMFEQQQRQQFHQAGHMNGMPQYMEQDIQFYERMMHQEDSRRQESRDDMRYAELYQEVFAPQARPHTMVATERTRGTTTITTERTHTQTSESRSTAGSGSSGSYSSESDYEDDNWEDNIMSAIQDMAGNLKKIGGIHCNQAGPDSTEVQLKLNLPLPMHNLSLNAAMASLSPKKCNMQYDFDNMQDNCTMDKVQGNVMPVYKSLFESQSESSSEGDFEDDEEESESTSENSRFLSKAARQPKRHHKQRQERKKAPVEHPVVDTSFIPMEHPVVDTSFITHNVDGIPSHILVSEVPPAVSSCDSWLLLSPRHKTEEPPTKSNANDIIDKINNNLDDAIRGSKITSRHNRTNHHKDEDWVPATKQQLLVLEEEPSIDKPRRLPEDPKPGRVKSNTNGVPQVIVGQHISESYSDLTFDHRKSSGVPKSDPEPSKKDQPIGNTPQVETQFSGDEIMGSSKKASFQRNSMKKGTQFNPELNDLEEEDLVVSKSDPPADPSSDLLTSPVAKKSVDKEVEVPDDELVDSRRKVDLGEEWEQMEAWERKKKKLEEERKRLEAEEKAEKESEEAERERKRVAAEEKAKAEHEAKILAEEIKLKEAEAKVKAEREALEALEAKRLEDEKRRLEAEAKAKAEKVVREAQRLEEERKRREARAKAKAEREALEVKRLEDERKRLEDEARAKELEEERRQMEAEAKAAREALEAQKLEEKRRKLEAELKAKAEKEELEAKKAEEERKRIKAEAKAKVEKEAMQAKKVREARKRLEAEAKARKEALEEAKKSTAEMPSSDRASLYEMKGFDDYCKSLPTMNDEVESHRAPSRKSFGLSDYDMYESENSERSASNTEGSENEPTDSYDEVESKSSGDSHSHSSNGEGGSVGTGSFDEQSQSSNSHDDDRDEESDIYTDASSYVEDFDGEYDEEYVEGSDSEEVTKRTPAQRSRAKNTETSEHTRSVHFTLSSGATVNTMDKAVPFSARKGFSKDSPMKSRLMTSASYASEMPLAITSTMSTLQTNTFDQSTVHSANRSLGRFLPCDESVVSTASYSHQSVMSAKPIATSVAREKKKTNEESELRSSILGSIISLILRLMFSIMIFGFAWVKHVVTVIGSKRQAKIDCTPTKFAMQPDKSIRREEIQDRSMDSLIHQRNSNPQQRAPYLLHDEPDREHTTMVVSPPEHQGYLADDSDEVGTCVGSIVPDTHHSAWKINPAHTGMSSLTSPPSRSFGVLKKAYSALSTTKCEGEKCNWMDHDNIDDEMSYYE